jgi:hypothetical protein
MVGFWELFKQMYMQEVSGVFASVLNHRIMQISLNQKLAIKDILDLQIKPIPVN